MRILLIDNANDTHSRRFLGMLLDDGHTVANVSLTNVLPEQAGQFTYHLYPSFIWTYGMRPYRLGKLIRDYLSGLQLYQIWRKFKPNVTHVLLVNPNAFHCALAGIHPLVLTSFGSDINELYESKSEDIELKERIRQTLRSADYVTSDTSEVLRKCNELAGKQLNSGLFYFGVDLDLFKPALPSLKEKLRNDLGIPRTSKVVISPRRLINKMRHEIVLKSFAEVIRCNNLDAVLVLRKYGSFSTQCESELKNLAVELKIADKLLWIDQMDYEKIPILYSLADLVVNVPDQDGLPVALFEASACMTPVITSNLPAYQEFLSKGFYYRVPVGDIVELSKTIQYILFSGDETIVENVQKNYELIKLEADQKKSMTVIGNIYKQISKVNCQILDMCLKS